MTNNPIKWRYLDPHLTHQKTPTKYSKMAKKEGVVQKQLNFWHVKGPKMEGVVAHDVQK